MSSGWDQPLLVPDGDARAVVFCDYREGQRQPLTIFNHNGGLVCAAVPCYPGQLDRYFILHLATIKTLTQKDLNSFLIKNQLK
ncbi:MAG: hypothetical protein EBY16_09915 [Gammaproteobacteria bacterium]|nr:hypothetical protein [Gammaproteobacteria bacterium]